MYTESSKIQFGGICSTLTDNTTLTVTENHGIRFSRRAYFVQNLWGHDPKMPTDVQQVWFPGVHCDVGGGYPEREAGLSKIALKWMVEKVEAFGLRFQPKAKAAILPAQDTPEYVAPSVTAPKHESLRGLWWIVEFVPKRFHDPAAGFAPSWIIHMGRPRYVGDGSTIHPSVFGRRKDIPAYRPQNLPKQFTQSE